MIKTLRADTLRHARFSDTQWTADARQGSYNGSGYAGFIGLREATDTDWSRLRAESMTMIITFGGSGYNIPKTVSFYRAAREVPTGRGDRMAGSFLGALRTPAAAYKSTVSVSVTGELMAGILSALPFGALCIRNDETSAANGYSGNYLSITAFTLVIDCAPAGSTGTMERQTVAVGDIARLTVSPVILAASVTHRVICRLPDGTALMKDLPEGDTEAAFLIPPSVADAFPDSLFADGTMELETYADGALYGTVTVPFTLTVPDTAAPSLTLAVTPEVVYRRLTTATLTAEAYGRLGARVLPVPPRALNYELAGARTETVTVTDSRGLSATASVTIDVIDVRDPVITAFTAQRYDRRQVGDSLQDIPADEGSRVRLSINCDVDPMGGNCGSLTLWEWREGWRMISQIDISGETEHTVDLGETDGPSDYRAILTDGVGAATETAKVNAPRANLTLAGSDYGVGVGCFAEDTDADHPRFEVAYPAVFRDTVTAMVPMSGIVWQQTATANAVNNGAVYLLTHTVERDGIALLHANLSLQRNTNGRRIGEMYKNGSSVARAIVAPANGDVTQFDLTAILDIKKGDVLTVAAWQNSGSTLSVTATAELLRLP